MVGSTPPRQRGAPPSPPAEIPETSPRSAQNTLLTLGGVLLGIAAVVVTGLFYTTSATGGRALVLAVATLLALSVPLLLTRRTLTATAETIAAFGLLLVLLDGYAAYNADLAGLRGVSLTLFSAVLFGLVAGGRRRVPAGEPPARAAVRGAAGGTTLPAADRRPSRARPRRLRRRFRRGGRVEPRLG